MNLVLALLISMSLSAPVLSIAADKTMVEQKVEKKVKKKHHKYAATKIPEKTSNK